MTTCTTSQTPPKHNGGGCVITTYRTYKGKKLGPYYFRKWKIGKKVFKEYIKPEPVTGTEMSRADRLKAAVEKARAACNQAKQRRREINRFLQNADFLRVINERYDRNKQPTPQQEAYIVRLYQEGMHIIGRPSLRPRRVFGVPDLFKHFIASFEKALKPPQTQKPTTAKEDSFGAPQEESPMRQESHPRVSIQDFDLEKIFPN